MSTSSLTKSRFPSAGSSIRESYLKGARPVNHERDDPLPMGVNPETLQRHKEYMTRIRKDREGLELELLQSEKAEKMKSDPKLRGELKQMNLAIDKHVKNIEDTRKRIRMIETLIQRNRERELTQNLSRGGVKITRENNEMIQKKITMMEKRLEKLLQQFNRKIVKNKTLRERIDKTRADRATFDRIFHKMESSVLGFDTSIEETKRVLSELEQTLKRERADLESKRLESEQSTQAFESKWKQIQLQLEDAKLENTLDAERLRSTLVGDNMVSRMSESSKMKMSAISALSSVHQWKSREREHFFEFRRRENDEKEEEEQESEMDMKEFHDVLRDYENKHNEDPVLVLEQSEDEQYRTFLQVDELQMQIQEQVSRVEMWKKRIQDAIPEKERAEMTRVQELENKIASTRKSTEKVKCSVSNMKSHIEDIENAVEVLFRRVIHSSESTSESGEDDKVSTTDKLSQIEAMFRRLGVITKQH